MISIVKKLKGSQYQNKKMGGRDWKKFENHWARESTT